MSPSLRSSRRFYWILTLRQPARGTGPAREATFSDEIELLPGSTFGSVFTNVYATRAVLMKAETGLSADPVVAHFSLDPQELEI
jgi:hypothetical protein